MNTVEERDGVKARPMLLILAAFAAVLVASFTGVRIFEHSLLPPNTAPAGSVKSIDEFPKPQLQVAPAGDFAAYRAQEDQVLSSYGREEGGFVRVPIRRAMEISAAGAGR